MQKCAVTLRTHQVLFRCAQIPACSNLPLRPLPRRFQCRTHGRCYFPPPASEPGCLTKVRSANFPKPVQGFHARLVAVLCRRHRLGCHRFEPRGSCHPEQLWCSCLAPCRAATSSSCPSLSCAAVSSRASHVRFLSCAPQSPVLRSPRCYESWLSFAFARLSKGDPHLVGA